MAEQINVRGPLSPFMPPTAPAATNSFNNVNPVDNSTPFNMSDPVTIAQSKQLKPVKSGKAAQTQDIMNSPYAMAYKNAVDPYDKKIEKLSQELSNFEGIKAEFKAESEASRAKSYLEASEKESKTLADANIINRLKENEEKSSIPFVPTQDNAKDLMTLFSLIGIVGFGIGAGGKANAQTAMAAMTGMFKGYREGRADLYKKEKIAFDESLRQLKAKTDALYKEYEAIVKIAATDRQQARERADLLFAQQGASFLKQYHDKFGMEKSLALVKEQRANMAEIMKYAQGEADRAETRAMRYAQLNQNKIYHDALIAAKTNGVAFKPGTKDTQGYKADSQALIEIENFKRQLQDPELKDQLKKYKWQNMLADDSKLADQVLREEMPSKLRQFVASIQNFRNNNYRSMSGLAVTGSEEFRNYGVNPQSADSAERMLDKLIPLERDIRGRIEQDRILFKFPDLTSALKPGMGTELVRGQAYSFDPKNNEVVAPSESPVAAPAPAPAASPLSDSEKQELEALRAKHKPK
jgi:hypothetical protein